jgi:flagellar basal body-associated protein FliL
MLFAAIIIISSIVIIAMSITMIIVTAISSSTITAPAPAPAPALPVAAPSSERFALDYVLGGQRIGVIVDIEMRQILQGTDRRGVERTRDSHGCRMSLSNRPH